MEQTVLVYPAGTVFALESSFPYTNGIVYYYIEGERYETGVTDIYPGSAGFTLPDDGIVYHIEMVNITGPTANDYVSSSSGGSAPAPEAPTTPETSASAAG